MTPARLLVKYRTLAALRARREELERAGRDRFDPEEGRQRARTFRALAAEFPGALRELEVTAASRLEARAGELEAALARGEVPRWALVAAAYHEELRAALAVKGWLARRLPRGGAVDAALVAAYLSWPGRPAALTGEPAAILERHLRPPQGRVHALVWASLEVRFAADRSELEALLFGS